MVDFKRFNIHSIHRLWDEPSVAYRWARRFLWLGLGLIWGWMICSTPVAIAASESVVNLAKQPAITVKVALGNRANELVFDPPNLTFEPGKRYKLILSNPSPQKHYFTAKDFADGIWSQKVDAGNVEIKGAIHELEIRPGAEAEWVFVPVRSGSYELHCSIPGHTEAGMTGSITIQNSNA